MKKVLFTLFISFFCLFVYGQKEPEMVTIPGGSFNMGSNDGLPDEKPMHRVTISSFKMGKYQVTVADFAAFVLATGYVAANGATPIFDNGPIGGQWISGVTWRDDEEGHKRKENEWNMPVIHVNWNDAIAYCKWLSNKTGKVYRLPTEAEYEYAAGNGERHTTYSWGNDLPGNGDAVANVRDETTHPKYGSWSGSKFTGYNDGYFLSSPVGCYAPNDLGLYDMTGNVWEWCSDWYNKDYYTNSPSTNPQGPVTGSCHVNRGGSYQSKPARCHVTVRKCGNSDERTPNMGFRVACSL